MAYIFRSRQFEIGSTYLDEPDILRLEQKKFHGLELETTKRMVLILDLFEQVAVFSDCRHINFTKRGIMLPSIYAERNELSLAVRSCVILLFGNINCRIWRC